MISSPRPSANEPISASPELLNGSTAIQNPAALTGAVISRAPPGADDEDCSKRLNAMSLADWNR